MTTASSPQYERRAALLIGIDEYEDARLAPLNCAVSDVELIYSALRAHCGFNEADITVLTNDDATLENIKRVASTVGSSLTDDLTQLIIFFAGHGHTLTIHGTTLGFLCPHDADLDSPYPSCLSMQDILTLSQMFEAHHVLFLLDCCFSGLVGVTSRAAAHAPYVEKMLGQRARQILTAGMAHEAALEDQSIGNGLFTRVLCEAIANPRLCGSGVLSAASLFPYVSMEVTRRTEKRQTPQFRQLPQFGEGDNILRVTDGARPLSDTPHLPPEYEALYSDPALYGQPSRIVPVSLSRALPFTPDDLPSNHHSVLDAEASLLRELGDDSVEGVLEAYVRCGILSGSEADTVRSVADYYLDADIFTLMAIAYSNSGWPKLALRWYLQAVADSENAEEMREPLDEAHAGVGYCLYKLGLYREGILWTKGLLGRQVSRNAMISSMGHAYSDFNGFRVHSVALKGDRAGLHLVANPTGQFSEKLRRRLDHLRRVMESRVGRPLAVTVYADAESVPAISRMPVGCPLGDIVGGPNQIGPLMTLVYCLYEQALASEQEGFKSEAEHMLTEAILLAPNASFLKTSLSQVRGG